MFWGKKSVKEQEKKGKVEKLPRPKDIPELVQKHLVAERKMDPDLAKIMKAVVRKSPKEEGAFDIRIFDGSEAGVKKVEVKDYTSLDEHTDLILYEGWFNEKAKRVGLEEKKKVSYDVPILSEEEIRQKIEELSQPVSTTFFYTARGLGQGGPLGAGCAVVELNPSYPGKKQKKYLVYMADVIDMQPTGMIRWFDSDKPKDTARQIKERHHKRMFFGYT